MEQIVRVKPIQIPTSRVNIKSIEKTTSGILPGVSHTLAPVLDSFGRVKTGTNEEDYAKIMEKETNPPPFNDFYSKLSFRIGEDGRELNLSISKHKLIYNFLLTLKTVAKEGEKINPSIHKYFIEDENEKAIKQLGTIQAKKEAYSMFDKMSPKDVRDFLVLYGKDASTVSDDVAQAKLGELLENDPKRFTTLFNDNNKEIRINLQKLSREGIVRKEGSSYFYGDKGENPVFLGATEEMAVVFLNDDENQELYISLISQI
jgi:hypothetical protein